MIKDRSFGIIPLRKENEQWFIFLIQHKNGLHWGFPKGHKVAFESDIQAATRELQEETGLTVAKFLSHVPFVDEYRFVKGNTHISKTVFYYPCLSTGDIKLQTKEIISGKWCTFEVAKDILTFDESKEILERVREFLMKMV